MIDSTLLLKYLWKLNEREELENEAFVRDDRVVIASQINRKTDIGIHLSEQRTPRRSSCDQDQRSTDLASVVQMVPVI